ncbi:hypothetical protein DPMN_178422 [Dreissena polymorpha]|uniref:Uncharacterized protein n=1 Tax=Dreissena polymorpha TaxID=45954 RepID=A0A9D4IMK9_DREPO|nr:hypothetical protein DPMN_178422 [Dreissena polymorpha]
MQGAAYEALEVAQGAVRLAETVVEGAQIALTAAQVVVSESRVSVDSAVAVLNIIEKGIGTVMYVIEKAANGLEAVEYLVNHGVNLTTTIIEVVSDSVIDVRDCGVTEFAYLSTDILESGIEIVCEVNFRGRGYKSVSRRLRLCDMFSPSKCNN